MANGDDSGVYVFNVQFSTIIEVNEYIKIEPPSNVVITPSAEQCKGIENLAPILSCTISDQSIYVRLFPEDPEDEDEEEKTEW